MGQASELKFISHSTLFYWWPVWSAGIVLGIFSRLFGVAIAPSTFRPAVHILSSSAPGFLFTGLLLLVVLITSVRLKGLPTILAIVISSIALIALAWLGWLDTLLSFMPTVSVHMTSGFYLFLSGFLFIAWGLGFVIFDRLCFWRIRDGKLERVRIFGRILEQHDLLGMRIETHSDDLLRHVILGFGSGDLVLKAGSGVSATVIEIRNVLGVTQKKKAIRERLLLINGD